METLDLIINLSIALACGLLIGIERGWQQREAGEGARLAGIRTFGLMGLLGGIWGLLSDIIHPNVLGFALIAVAGIVTVAHVKTLEQDKDQGITTLVALLIAFSLGALAVNDFRHISATAAVTTVLLLGLKPTLHGWLRRLERDELFAAAKLLLISVVLLPVLPNQGYGPWQALNPYEIWWLIVLIASISFVGYIAMKIVGTKRGVLITGALGGLVSSTAVTVNFSRYARKMTIAHILAAGILMATVMMFPRMLLETAVVNYNLVWLVAGPLMFMFAGALINVALLWRRHQGGDLEETENTLPKPFEMGPALKFGLFLAAIMVLIHVFKNLFGEAGVYMLAVLSGVADVDAITLSLAGMAKDHLPATVAADGIVIAALVNCVAKWLLVWFIAGNRLGLLVLPGFLTIVVIGGLSVFFYH